VRISGYMRKRLERGEHVVRERFGVDPVAKQTLSRELRAMGYRKLSARPRHHAQAAGVIEDFKKASPRAWMQSCARKRSVATR